MNGIPTFRQNVLRKADKQDRRNSYKRGYTKAWARFRKNYLTRHPMCSKKECKNFATEVDHKIPLEDGGEKYDEDNLQGFCKSCHSKKTVEQDGGLGRRKRIN